MHRFPLPFSNTVLLKLKSPDPYGNGIQNSFIPWETWLMTPEATLRLMVETKVRKWHLAKHISYSYSVASTIPNKILCAAVWHKSYNADISRPLSTEFGTVFTGRRHSNCYEQIITFDIPVKDFDCVDGFLTENNVFLNREQAWLVAGLNGQLLPYCKEIIKPFGSNLNAQVLISEMLYED